MDNDVPCTRTQHVRVAHRLENQRVSRTPHQALAHFLSGHAILRPSGCVRCCRPEAG